MRARRHYFADEPGPKPLVNDPVGRQHRIPHREDEVCIHPRREVRWYPHSEVAQCGRCGAFLYDEEDEGER